MCCQHATPPAKGCNQAKCHSMEYGEEVLKDVLISGLHNREIVQAVHAHADIDKISISDLSAFIKKHEYSLLISAGAVAKAAAVDSTPAPPHRSNAAKKAGEKAPGSQRHNCDCGAMFETRTYNARGTINKEDHAVCKAC